MRRQDAINHFGGQKKLADALGCAQSTVAGWKHERIPLNRALQIQQLTKGKLRANLDEYLRRERRA